jgi:hypothetical protein
MIVIGATTPEDRCRLERSGYALASLEDIEALIEEFVDEDQRAVCLWVDCNLIDLIPLDDDEEEEEEDCLFQLSSMCAGCRYEGLDGCSIAEEHQQECPIMQLVAEEL